MMSINELIRRSNSPTPLKYKKVGKSIALLGTMVQVAMGSLQVGGAVDLPGHYALWVIGLAVVQWLGQTITEFATDDSEDISKIQNGQV